jgi:hypothetical protein
MYVRVTWLMRHGTQGTLTQLRFHPAILTDPVTGVTKGPSSKRSLIHVTFKG